MTFEEYQDFYQILPEKVQKKLEIDWGKGQVRFLNMMTAC